MAAQQHFSVRAAFCTRFLTNAHAGTSSPLSCALAASMRIQRPPQRSQCWCIYLLTLFRSSLRFAQVLFAQHLLTLSTSCNRNRQKKKKALCRLVSITSHSLFFPSSFPPELLNLIQLSLVENPTLRPSLDKVCRSFPDIVSP